MPTRLAALLALAALSVAACRPGRSATEFCTDRFEALQSRDERCGVSPDVAEASWTPPMQYTCSAVSALDGRGRLAYDPTLAERCLQRLAELPCGPWTPVPDDPCEAALVGTVEAGGSCNTGVECVPGTLCAASTCPGTCVARAAVGFECGGLVRCEEGAYCLSGSCVANVQEGGACRVGSLDCADGLYCAGEKPSQPATSPGACKPVGEQQSGACDQAIACVFGKVCAGQDTLANVAGSCEAPVADGGACEVSSSCGPESFCKDGACSPRPRLGEPCGIVGGGSAECLLGWCRTSEAGGSTCAEFLKATEACDSAQACGPLARCQDGACIPFCADFED